MCRVYSLFRQIATNPYWMPITLLVFAMTIGFGVWGFAEKSDGANSTSTNFYLVMLLFALNSGEVAANVNWQLNVARWCGFAIWAYTVFSVFIRLFSQRFLIGLVAVVTIFKKGHVIVAGLGRSDADRERLVQRLRAQGQDVIVVEPDAEHPGLDACRQVGAICLLGSPFEETMMVKARLKQAGSLLALCDDDRKNVTLLSLTSKVLGPAAADSREDENPLTPPRETDVGCVVQVSEPRLLEVLRRHRLQRDAGDRLHLRIFSPHEMVARAMIRESLIGTPTQRLNKVLVIGTGAYGRLAEVLVLRLIKDRWIDWDHGVAAEPIAPLAVDIYDEHAVDWVDALQADFNPVMRGLCTLTAIPCPATQCGLRVPQRQRPLAEMGYDAVFVCLSQEPHAMIQASQVQTQLPNTPVVVRVHEEESGFGQLLRQQADAVSAGLDIRVVGTHDRVFDIATSLNPAVEIFAQVLHQDYLFLTEQKRQAHLAANNIVGAKAIEEKAAFKSWRLLHDEYKESNRALAERLTSHLTVPAADGKPARTYRPVFRPRTVIDPAAVYRLSPDELERLAEQEHALWKKQMEDRGWRLGSGGGGPHSSDPERKLNPNLVDWDSLNPGMKDFDRHIIRRLPYLFAKADYELVEVK